MKYYQMPIAEVRPGDHSAMIEAIHSLQAAGIDVRRPEKSPFQLKVTDTISYYPTRGTIFADGTAAPRPQRGLRALLALLAEQAENPPIILS